MNFKKDGLITKEFVNTFIVERKKDIHKGDCGRVLIIAGSMGMAGAAILSATGALRSGAGLVKVAIDEFLFPILQIGIPEAICIPRKLSGLNLTEFKAIAIGPGLGDDDNEELIKEILKTFEGVLIFDADGLKTLLKLKELALMTKASVIITPHSGEAGRLLNISANTVNGDRLRFAKELSKKFNCVTALKGKDTVVATQEGKTYINTTGNPGMATAGSGDVLTGVISALAAQGLESFPATACGVYLHGLAGDIGSEIYGEYGLIASDIATNVALAIKEFQGFDI